MTDSKLVESRLTRFKRTQFIRDFKMYKKHTALCLMFLPTVVFFVVFRYVPMAGIMMAFQDFRLGLGMWNSPFTGLDNFRMLFSMATFQRALTNTIWISLLRLFWGFPAPILLAILLNEIRHTKFKRTVQTISYLPFFLSWVVLGGIFITILSPTTGMVNDLLGRFGIDPIFFLGNNDYFRSTLVATGIWRGAGWGSILFLAAIAGIDSSLYETAMCDGASRWQRIRYITLPCLMPTITIMLILNIGSLLDGGFDQIFNLYNPAVYASGDILDTYVFRIGLGQMRFGLATAAGLFTNGVGFVLVVFANYVAKKIGDYGIW